MKLSGDNNNSGSQGSGDQTEDDVFSHIAVETLASHLSNHFPREKTQCLFISKEYYKIQVIYILNTLPLLSLLSDEMILISPLFLSSPSLYADD